MVDSPPALEKGNTVDFIPLFLSRVGASSKEKGKGLKRLLLD